MDFEFVICGSLLLMAMKKARKIFSKRAKIKKIRNKMNYFWHNSLKSNDAISIKF